MLSPIITTIGNLKRLYQAASCWPMSYCGLSPVPLSPITAKCSVSALLGSGTCDGAPCPPWAATATDEYDGDGLAQQISPTREHRNTTACRRRGFIASTLFLFEGLRDPVRDDVGVRIEQDQVLPHETIF